MHKIIDEDAKIIVESEYIDWSKLNNKTVLISGANGYVPQFFVHAFIKRNDLYGSNIKVIALCRNKEKTKERFGEYFERSDFRMIYQDICDPLAITEKLDFIIHAASPAGIRVTMEKPIAVFEANLMGMKNIASIALINDARVLYISSVDVYGHIDEIKRYEETDIGYIDHLESRNIYATSKRATESLCMCYGKNGLDYIIARPSQIMGPGISLNDERLHINMINQMITTGKIILKGDGTPKRSFIYVTDAIIGLLVVMTKGESQGIYNVCNENAEATVKELAEMISNMVSSDKGVIEYDCVARKKDPAVTSVVLQVCISSRKLQEIGWKPQIGLNESSRRMIDYYRGEKV